MKTIDVTLLTCPDYENPTSTTEYVQNVLLEDRLIAEALQAKGQQVSALFVDGAAGARLPE